jgi:enolase
MVEFYADLVDRFPIWSMEDGLAEDDEAGWRELTTRLGEQIQLVGDDIFVTNADMIAQAVENRVGNAALLKVNQAGTVTETLDAAAVCRRSGYAAMVSHRSGETTDPFIADLTVALGCGQLKSGAPARGERVAKYNRLLAIAAADPTLAFGLPDDARRWVR